MLSVSNECEKLNLKRESSLETGKTSGFVYLKEKLVASEKGSSREFFLRLLHPCITIKQFLSYFWLITFSKVIMLPIGRGIYITLPLTN
jgi:hypothetical protein